MRSAQSQAQSGLYMVNHSSNINHTDLIGRDDPGAGATIANRGGSSHLANSAF